MAEQFHFFLPANYTQREVILVAQKTTHLHTPKWELVGSGDGIVTPCKIRLSGGSYISPGPFTTQKNALQFAKLHGHRCAIRDRKGRVNRGPEQTASRFQTQPWRG